MDPDDLFEIGRKETEILHKWQKCRARILSLFRLIVFVTILSVICMHCFVICFVYIWVTVCRLPVNSNIFG